MPPVNGHRYLPSTAILLIEIVKLSAAVTMALYDISLKQPNLPATTLFGALATSMFALESWKMIFPSLLEVLQNAFQFTALSNLDGATYLTTFQSRLVVSGVVGFAILGKGHTTRKWMSLLMLALAISIIHMPYGATSLERLREGSPTSYFFPRSLDELRNLGNTAAQQLAKRSATYQGIEKDSEIHYPQLNTFAGLMASLGAALMCGLFASYSDGVFKENVSDQGFLAGKPGSGSWVRNAQMSVYAIIVVIFGGIMLRDADHISRNGFFAGYNVFVWSMIFIQGFGGASIALLTSHMEDRDKSLGACLSILSCFVGSALIFELDITFYYILGTSVAMGALWLQGMKEGKSAAPTIQIAQYEKSPSESPQAPSYFDLESAGRPRSPRPEGLSTSRPNTPLGHRHHFRSASGRGQE